MDQPDRNRVWAAIGALARQEGTPVALRHAVIACADSLAAAGAGLALARNGTPREPLLASNAVAEELEELQFLLGQGPSMDAAAGRGPVLVTDLAGSDAQRRWPVFAPAAVDHGIRGMFAFPVATGAALVGVLDAYRHRPGPLDQRELADALMFADAMLLLTLDSRGGIPADLSDLLDTALSARRAHVHQATGMVAAQLEVSVTDALAALRAHAFTHGRRLGDVAADVVGRRIRLSADAAENGPAGPSTTPERQGEDGGIPLNPGGQAGRQEED
ncbi:MAG: GAF and ANTAR domain-containing protein [Trebonia sp.]